jgi:hypothetical protein
MATTTTHNRREGSAGWRIGLRRHRTVIAVAVEGLGLLLRLPLVAHIALAVVTELVITVATGRRGPAR